MSFINDLLYLINELGELLPEHKNNYRNLAYRNRPSYYKSLKRLESRGQIKRKVTKVGRVSYQITSEGKRYLRTNLAKAARADGLSTLITYDIPLDKSKERTIFRRFLIKNGYVLIQRSLLVSPHKLDDRIIALARELKIHPYIKIVSGRFEYHKIY